MGCPAPIEFISLAPVVPHGRDRWIGRHRSRSHLDSIHTVLQTETSTQGRRRMQAGRLISPLTKFMTLSPRVELPAA